MIVLINHSLKKKPEKSYVHVLIQLLHVNGNPLVTITDGVASSNLINKHRLTFQLSPNEQQPTWTNE